MKLLIVSTAPLISSNAEYFAYSPYAKEMRIWAKHADQVAFCCPIWNQSNGLLHEKVGFPITKVFALTDFNANSFKDKLHAVTHLFSNLYIIYQAMQWADHIHLRCPGNVGLLGCFVQMLFPKKIKTAKYAGNWDPKSAQPAAYRFQKWLLNNTFLMRNITVLVYGKWQNASRNIKPFFTATYTESDKAELLSRSSAGTIKFMFVGTLTVGKHPLYAVKLIEALHHSGHQVMLEIFGDGMQRAAVEQYIEANNLSGIIRLNGNQKSEIVKEHYQSAHFLILPSESEGWPKVVAEAMFWGCVPISTPVSCVPFMLDYGTRGLMLQSDLAADVASIAHVIKSPETYQEMHKRGSTWSRQFTLDVFEDEIRKLLK